ncbi:response regulator transcription factor [Luteibacter sp. PPL201]|jgi:DNA-binding NarL/FixJ family response regulator|uniref:Response regulator transcription factor n=1 Tax=Luteibacter sahnii TaxID=3021977 RepID=A0ABT6B5U7_9GAMM|nr:response regulator transcription factor [Luteibacter sp. PPL193]MDY1548643.1 response regulator transcription factor [Luteibacter sp. PPL193]
MTPVSVLLGDEQAVLREGVAALLLGTHRFDVVGGTGDGRELVRMALRLQPRLLIFDCAMRGLSGLEAARRLGPRCPETRMLCLSAYDDSRWVRAAIDAGAHGYVLKRDGYGVLSEGIEAVLKARYFVSPDIGHVLVDGLRRRAGASAMGMGAALSTREREVTQLFAEGLSTRQIAERLHVSVKTVGTHREHIMSKLGLQGIAQLTRYALREGLTVLEPGMPDQDG